MHHIDEHILELYVLNSPKVENQRDGIDAHLTECLGCKKLVDEMRAFHEELKEELKQTPLPETSETSALAKRKSQIEPYFEPYIPPAPSSAIVRSFEKFTLFVRKNPVTTAAGSLVFLASIVGLLYFGMVKNKVKAPEKDLNPTYYKYTAQNFLDVYNKENEIVWEMPIRDAYEHTYATPYGIFFTWLSDLNGDGIQEIITTTRDSRDPIYQSSILRIVNLSDTTIKKISFTQPFQYLRRKNYSFSFPASCFLIKTNEYNKKEIYLACRNSTRSPFFLARLDREGNTIGRYWHFGQFNTIYFSDVNQDKKDEIVLCGSNDSQDSTNGEYACVSVIDPTKIMNDSKSTATTGFEMPLSNAEIFYIKFPLLKLNKITVESPSTQDMIREKDDFLQFTIVYGHDLEPNTNITFYFFFSSDLKIKEVKSSDALNHLMQKLYVEKKINTPINGQFLQSLKDGVRYWDGKKWCKEWTMVKH